MALYRVWFRKPPAGIESKVIDASSTEMAEMVGKKWCELQSIGLMKVVRYARVEQYIVADESILDPSDFVKEEVAEVAAAPAVEKKKWTDTIKEKVTFG